MSAKRLTALLLLTTYITHAQTPDPDPVVDFLRQNPARSALCVIRNDTVLISRQPDQKMPLASAMKTIIAIEFAQQVATGKLNAAKPIPLADLDLYYLPGTDGDAHPNWKASLNGPNQLPGGSVALLEVAKGMIQFSSNANTEYLTDRLGLAAINANLTALNLSNHDPIYPVVSSLLLYSTTDSAKTMTHLRRLSPNAYAAECAAIHDKLKAAKSGTVKGAFIFPDMGLQKMWSARLPASTVREYASVMQKISSRTYFPAPVQAVLDSIMEWPFRVNPGNKAVYRHLGAKGGSTGFVLTNAFYAETLRGNRVATAVFFNDLTDAEMALLRQQLDAFVLRCIGKTSSATLAEALTK